MSSGDQTPPPTHRAPWPPGALTLEEAERPFDAGEGPVHESGSLILHESVKRRLLEAALGTSGTSATSTTSGPSAAQGLRWSEDRIALALDASRSVLWDFDLASRKTRYSKNAARLLGFVGEVPPITPHIEHVHPDDRARLEADLGRAVIEGGVGEAEFRWIRPIDGELLWLQARSQTERDASGAVAGTFGLLTDVTSRKRAEEIEREYHRIEAAIRARSKLIAHMSHELRTPLNAIIGFTQLIHDGHVEPGSPEHHEFVVRILASSRRLLALIEDLLLQTDRSLDSEPPPPTC